MSCHAGHFSGGRAVTLCHQSSMMHHCLLADRIDRLTAAIGRAVAWLALVIVLLQFALVVARYVLGFGSIWLHRNGGLRPCRAVPAGGGLDAARRRPCARRRVLRATPRRARRALIDLARRAPAAAAVRAGAAVAVGALCRALLGDPRTLAGDRAACRWCSCSRRLIPLFAVLMALQGVAQAIRARRRPARPDRAALMPLAEILAIADGRRGLRRADGRLSGGADARPACRSPSPCSAMCSAP